VEVDVDTVEADNEVAEDVLLSLGDVGEERLDHLLTGREGLADGEEELERLGVDIADVDTALVGEVDPVTVTERVDADIVLGVLGVGEEGLDDEGLESTSGGLDLDGLAGALGDPVAGGLPVLANGEEAGLAAALNELVGLADELGLVEDELGEAGSGLDRGLERRRLVIPLDLGDADGGRGRLGDGGDGGGGASKPVVDQTLGVVLADSWG
jgi:hypothetical protein